VFNCVAVHLLTCDHAELSGKMAHVNQYSVSQKTLDKGLVAQGTMLGSGVVKDFQGLIINYDFSPVLTCN
jgi:hypothetical protein